MNLTRADIRRTLLRRGKYDLDDPESVRKLDQYVEGYERWIRSDVASLLGGDGFRLSPRELLDGISWGNSNLAKKNEKDVLQALRQRSTVKLIGGPALRVGVAFAKQLCIQRGWMPIHLHASNLITDELEFVSQGPRSVLILETWPDADHGRIFVEAKSKVISLLRDHKGATVIVCERDERGVLDQTCTDIKKPQVQFKVTEKR